MSLLRSFRPVVFAALLFPQTVLGTVDFASLDPGTTTLSLVTAGQGSDVTTIAGHSMLLVQNSRQGVSQIINWGVFDDEDPDFIRNFIGGRLDYSVIADEASSFLAYYREGQRTIWVHALQMTPNQTFTVLQEIQWWLQPQNSRYRYHFWLTNCATIIRDILEKALGGQFRRLYLGPNGHTIRSFGEPLFTPYPGLSFGADLLIGSAIDQPMDHWTEFFAPVSFSKLLAMSPRFDDAGQPVPGSMLLTASIEPVFTGMKVEPPFLRFENIITVVFALLLALVLHWRRRAARRALRVAGLMTTMAGLLFGIFGTAMAAAWCCTEHVLAHQNLNLWLVWPWDLLWVIPGVSMMLWPDRWTAAPRLHRVFIAAAAVRALIWATLAGLALFGAVEQSLWAVSVYLVPAMFLSAAALKLVEETTDSLINSSFG